jgi:hypothetical protein
MEFNQFGYTAKGQLFDTYQQADPAMRSNVVAAIISQISEDEARKINTSFALGAGAAALFAGIVELFASRKRST